MRYSESFNVYLCYRLACIFLHHSSTTTGKSLKSIDVVETERRAIDFNCSQRFLNSLLNNKHNSTIKRLKLNGSSEHRTLCNYLSTVAAWERGFQFIAYSNINKTALAHYVNTVLLSALETRKASNSNNREKYYYTKPICVCKKTRNNRRKRNKTSFFPDRESKIHNKAVKKAAKPFVWIMKNIRQRASTGAEAR